MSLSLPLLVEPDTLSTLPEGQRQELLIIDVGQTSTYRQLHIPGAVHIPPGQLVCGMPPAAGKLPSPAQLDSLFGSIGYDPDRAIVVYDDEGGGWAGRLLWTLDVIGHRRASILNGGLHAWVKEGHQLSREPVKTSPAPLSLAIDSAPIAELDEVKAAIDDQDTIIWDARSREEYIGLKMTARRNGHIPGAVNLEWLSLMDHDRNLRLLPDAALRARLAAAGISGEQRIITHCHSHHRSGLSYLAARQLGFAVKAYHGSWSEWGNLPDTPITEGPDA